MNGSVVGIHLDVINFSVDVNECLSSPCGNNGDCNDEENGYNCVCDDDWVGTHCNGELSLVKTVELLNVFCLPNCIRKCKR